MEAFRTLSTDATALLWQDSLTGPLWGSTDLTSFIGTIQLTVGKAKVGLQELSDLSPQVERLNPSDSSPLLSSTSGALESRLNQPYYHRYNVPSNSDHEVKAVKDPLTGMAEGGPLVSAQAINTKINFQPDDALVAKGHIKDAGKPYNATQGFGWVKQGTHIPLDVTANARDRDRPGIYQRLDTLIHMQGNDIPGFTGVEVPAAWEYKLPDGTYKVTVGVGDQPNTLGMYGSQHTINVEGVTAINDFQGSATQEYKKATVQVNVSDGLLTIDAIGGTNTKINYIEIASNFTQIDWSAVASSPLGRSEAAGAVVDGRVYTFGGFVPKSGGGVRPISTSYVYNPTSDAWTEIAPLPKPLTHAGVAANGNNIYIAGGNPGTATGGQLFATKDVWQYSVNTNQWSAITPLPQARGSGGLEVLGRELHFFGGNNSKRTQDMGDHWALNLDNPTAGWVRKASLPNPRTHMGDAVLGGKLYAIGGQHGEDKALVTQNSVHEYNPLTNTWKVVKPLPKALSHIGGGTFVMDGRIIVAGGETKHGPANVVADVMAYNPVSDSWQALTSLPVATHSGIAGRIENQIFFTTGRNRSGFASTTYKGVLAS